MRHIVRFPRAILILLSAVLFAQARSWQRPETSAGSKS